MMVISLAACGDNNTTDTGKDKPGTSQSADNNNDVGNTDESENTNSGGNDTTNSTTSGNTNVLHELFDIQQLASITAIPDFAKKAIGDLRWCDVLGADNQFKYY